MIKKMKRTIHLMRWISLTVLLTNIVLATTASAQWIDALPVGYRNSILWSADHEKGDLTEWTKRRALYPGGGVFNTGGQQVTAKASRIQAHSGRYAALTEIRHAYRAKNGNRAVRLMRWTDRPFDQDGDNFPTSAYYSTWMYFPRKYNPNKYESFDPGDGGFWNVFQFKADDANGNSQPMFVLNIYHDDDKQHMEFYLYSDYNAPNSFAQATPIAIPVGEWFHIEARYDASPTNDGKIAIWQNGVQILNLNGVRTTLVPENNHAVWGIGNYTNHVAGDTVEGKARIYFDDSIVATRRISRSLTDE
jgi:hypothetical protein